MKVNLFVPSQLNGMSSFGSRLSNQQGVDLDLRSHTLRVRVRVRVSP